MDYSAKVIDRPFDSIGVYLTFLFFIEFLVYKKYSNTLLDNSAYIPIKTTQYVTLFFNYISLQIDI